MCVVCVTRRCTRHAHGMQRMAHRTHTNGVCTPTAHHTHTRRVHAHGTPHTHTHTHTHRTLQALPKFEESTRGNVQTFARENQVCCPLACMHVSLPWREHWSELLCVAVAGLVTTNNGLEALNGLMKIILADGLGTRQDVMAALRKLLEVMRTMSQRSASRQAPTDPCLDWRA